MGWASEINAAGCHRRAKQSSGTGPCGDCRRVLCIPGPWGQYSGKKLFYREIRSTKLWGRHVATRSSDPRVAYPCQSSGAGPIGARCGYCCPLCPTGSQYSGRIRFIELQGVNKHSTGDLCRVPPAAVRHEGQEKFRDGTMWGLKRGPLGTGPAASVFEENSFYRETRGISRVTICLNVVLTPG